MFLLICDRIIICLYSMIFIYNDADSKIFKSGGNAIHVWDLNFMLRSAIFMHFDSQLRASHLILDCTPIHTSYQDSKQVLIVDSLLLSYIDVQHQGFLSSRLTVGEARDLDPRVIRVGSRVPVRDGSANTIFQGRAVHIPVEEPCVEVQAADQVKVRSIDSLKVEVEKASDEMIDHRNMTAD